jgi:predicted nucleic acid-binding protein
VVPLPVDAEATALIGLARSERLALLPLLPGPIKVTVRVWQEVAAVPTKPGGAAPQRAWEEGLVVVVEEGDPNAVPQVDPGASTVLTAAAAQRAAVIIDEHKARAVIDADPERSGAIREAIGIVGLILRAQCQGRISAVRPRLDDLVREAFWLSPAFSRKVLGQAGER